MNQEKQPMKTDLPNDPTKLGFLQTVGFALADLKRRLRHDYERAYPDLREIIHLILDQEELRAWSLTLFPHLVLPDLVEAHIAKLNLQPAKASYRDRFAFGHFSPIPRYKPAAAFC
jgi:hypothetical protein